MKDKSGNGKMFVIGCAAGLLTAVIIAIVCFAIFFSKTKGTDSDNAYAIENSSIHGVTEESGALSGENSENGKNDSSGGENNTDISGEKTPDIVLFDMEEVNSWNSALNINRQYNVTLKNICDKDIVAWSVVLVSEEAFNVSQNWNCETQTGTEDGKNTLMITSVQYNEKINSNTEVKDIGFIIEFTNGGKFTSYRLELVTSDNSVYTVNSDGSNTSSSNGSAANGNSANGNSANGNSANGAATDENQDNTASDNSSSENDNSDSDDNADGSSEGTSNVPDNSQTPVKATGAGRLHVSGTSLADADGNKVVLRGVSTHGLAWYPGYVSYDAFKTLKDDWGANVVRLAMYTEEYGGYCNGGDKDSLKTLIDNGVNYATQLGLYVIIDWHILSDGNPNTNKSEAISFFDEISKKYAGNTNVLYEICNEPQNSDWNSVIKPYAEEVISTIRKNDSNAVIIVGTNTWSQDVDAVVGNRLDDDNVMYALHFYASTHKDNIRNKLKTAINGGVPVFVSECSITDASGSGNIDYDSANEWLKLLNENGVSFVAWSLCNKNETSALIKPECTKLSGWSEAELSDTGKWFRTAIKGK